MASNRLSVPPNAEKWLFAEDLINFVIAHCCCVPEYENLKSAERFRDYVFNGFCYTVRAGVGILYKLQKFVVKDDFVEMKDIGEVTPKSFFDYAKNHREYYFEEGFVGDYFLKYCIRIALLSYYLYEDGVRDAPAMAVHEIMRGFPASSASDVVWKSVYFAALWCSNFTSVSGSVRNNPYINRKEVLSDGSSLQRSLSDSAEIECSHPK